MPSLSIWPSAIPSDLVVRGRLLRLDRPRVMGILNATPDSFHAPSRAASAPDAVRRAGEMLSQGADIIDIGACSTRPGSESPAPEEEMRRLEAVVPALREAFPEAMLSIDTFRASVAGHCLDRWGVEMINDVSGGDDPDMFATVAAHGAAYVLMHMRGIPADMDSRCDYADVTADVVRELAFRVDAARAAGICNLVVDPGFGFAKTEAQNFELLRNLDRLAVLGCPVLVGMSRKRMTHEAGGDDTSALAATVALNAVAMTKGAAFVRVHDVREAAAAANMISKLWNSE